MASVTPMDAPKKVVIVGAGVSGLLAGHLLKEKGIEVEILEASSRWGGRIKDAAAPFDDFPVALGAEWVHSEQVFSAAEMYGCLACMFEDEVLHTANCPIFEDITAAKCAEHATFPDCPSDIKAVVGGKVVEADDMAKWVYSVPGDHKFKASSWVTVFEQRVLPSVKDSIVLNSEVTAIDYEGGKVTVKTKSGTAHEGDRAIVCVPLSMLKQNRIAFTPALPAAKAAAIAKSRTNPGLKVFLEFTEKFYPHFLLMQGMEDAGYYMYMDETVGKTTEKHILALVVLGDISYGKVTAKGDTDENIKAYVLSELDGVFDGKATATLKECVVQNWKTEPFIECGAPAFDDPNFDPVALAAPLNDKVFFAGDAFNPVSHNNIYVQGACETAYIAVKAMAP
jgi:monoamine oxidase